VIRGLARATSLGEADKPGVCGYQSSGPRRDVYDVLSQIGTSARDAPSEIADSAGGPGALGPLSRFSSGLCQVAGDLGCCAAGMVCAAGRVATALRVPPPEDGGH
jgi:hypothetical protein